MAPDIRKGKSDAEMLMFFYDCKLTSRLQHCSILPQGSALTMCGRKCSDTMSLTASSPTKMM